MSVPAILNRSAGSFFGWKEFPTIALRESATPKLSIGFHLFALDVPMRVEALQAIAGVAPTAATLKHRLAIYSVDERILQPVGPIDGTDTGPFDLAGNYGPVKTTVGTDTQVRVPLRFPILLQPNYYAIAWFHEVTPENDPGRWKGSAIWHVMRDLYVTTDGLAKFPWTELTLQNFIDASLPFPLSGEGMEIVTTGDPDKRDENVDWCFVGTPLPETLP